MSAGTLNKILLVRPDAIGDVTLMIPLINSIKATYPKAEVYTLQQAYTKALLDQHPNVKSVLIDRKKSGEAKGLVGFFNYVSWIKSFNFDAVIFSYLDAYYLKLAFFSGIPIRIGDGQKIGLRLFLTHPISQPFRELPLHEIEQNLLFMKGLSESPVLSHTMNLGIEEGSLKRAQVVLEENGWTGGDLIGVHPTTGGGNRAWSMAGYASLIKTITKGAATQVLLTGFGSEDAKVVNEIESLSKVSCVNVVNKTSLHELIAMITLVKAMIGTDTGPTHIAAALKVPVLCISPTKFVKSLRWGPWGTKNRIVGFPEKCDFVCNPHVCTKPVCLDAISAEAVYAELQELLKAKESANPKVHWFKKSCTVMIYVSNTSYVEKANRVIQRLENDCIRFHVVARTRGIANRLNKVDQIMSMYSPFFFRKIVIRDINVIHCFGKKKIWLQVLRQVVAPAIYCPPIIVYDVPHSSQTLSKFYMAGFTI